MASCSTEIKIQLPTVTSSIIQSQDHPTCLSHLHQPLLSLITLQPRRLSLCFSGHQAFPTLGSCPSYWLKKEHTLSWSLQAWPHLAIMVSAYL